MILFDPDLDVISIILSCQYSGVQSLSKTIGHFLGAREYGHAILDLLFLFCYQTQTERKE
jgi:hypothetical protein